MRERIESLPNKKKLQQNICYALENIVCTGKVPFVHNFECVLYYLRYNKKTEKQEKKNLKIKKRKARKVFAVNDL